MKYLLLLLTLTSGLAAQNNWLDFRGPDHNGFIKNRLPEVWSEKEHVSWKTALHDHGISTPVILDNTIVLTAATEDGGKNYFLTLDYQTGEIIHDKLIFTNGEVEPLGGFGINTYATPSPVSDGKIQYDGG